MIPRYTRPVMGKIWSDRGRLDLWCEVEFAHLETLEHAGLAPPGISERARARGRIDPARVEELEATLGHDVLAFLTALGESLGSERPYLHYGLTSSDLLDTALALQIKRSWPPIEDSLRHAGARLRDLAEEHRDTLMAGRTHGVHAEPISFGYKMLTWYAELGRQHTRLTRAFAGCGVGKLSGAVGTSAHLDPVLEVETLRRLGLETEPAATQVVPRDRHAELLGALANLGASCERFALEIRHLQRTEVREAEEPFARGQKGSSAMPHKRNPILCERITGGARLLRAHAVAALENVALWHERDISHSSVERVILPDSLTLTDYLLDRLCFVLDGMRLFPAAMAKNLEGTGGLIFSQRVLLELTTALLDREKAYGIVQSHCQAIWDDGGSLLDRLLVDGEVTSRIAPEHLRRLFDPRYFLRHLEPLYARALARRWELGGQAPSA